MEGFFNAVSAVVVIFLMISVGYFMGYKGWMGKGEKGFVSKYIINIAVPCTCLTGILNNLNRAMLADAGTMVVAAFLTVGMTLLFAMGAGRALKLPRERSGVFSAMAGLSNVIFVGMPLVVGIFGEAAIPYLMIYYLANTTLLQTVGLALIQRSGAQTDGGGGGSVLRAMAKKPPVIAIFVSVALLVTNLRPPEVLMTFAQYISDTVSVMALIYCGFVVYEVGIKNLRLLPALPLMLVLRLAVAPLTTWVVCSVMGMNGLALGVFVVASALPVVSQVPVYAGACGADEEYAATGACLSLLGCFFSIPILMLLLG